MFHSSCVSCGTLASYTEQGLGPLAGICFFRAFFCMIASRLCRHGKYWWLCIPEGKPDGSAGGWVIAGVGREGDVDWEGRHQRQYVGFLNQC